MTTQRRPPQPEDLYRFRIPTRPRLSPDGEQVAFVVQTVAPAFDAYRQSVWLAPADGSEAARRLTVGPRRDHSPEFSPDGRTLAFLSDRRGLMEEEPAKGDESKRDDLVQVHLLPLVGGGEARRLTDLPGGVSAFAWSPDGRRLVVVSDSLGATREEDRRLRRLVSNTKPKAGAPPASDIRYTDRLRYLANGSGFVAEHVERLWLVDAATGEATRLTTAREARESAPAWSPDGTRVAFVAEWGRDWDIAQRTQIAVVRVATGVVTPLTAGADASFGRPAWLPDGRHVVALGGRVPANAYRSDIWLLAADGSGAVSRAEVNLSGRHDLEPGAGMNSDITIGEGPRLVPSADGAWVTFLAPVRGAYEACRIGIADGALERLTEGRHYLSSFDEVALPGGGSRIAAIVSAATAAPEVHVLDVSPATPATGSLRRVTALNDALLADLDLVEPEERWVTVDGRTIQGWLLPAREPAGVGRVDGATSPAPAGPRPLVTQIHGGPHTLYGWSPVFEFQVLAGQGMGVFACNPRGSEGYGKAFVEANLGDWGPGPMADVLAGVDALVAEGIADATRLGVTGGSYGGYLTNWIIGHDQRFRAALTCRCVSDMTTIHLTGDLSSGDWPLREFGAVPWDDWAYFRSISPITYAEAMRTPLLIQHAENDLRCTIAQAESLFTVLRSLGRPVRLMRVPGESHELTRSGTPYRRVEHLVQVRDWFAHYLVKGARRLPPLPKVRATR